MTTDVIRFGLDAIANVSEDTARMIASYSPYASMIDFLERNPAVGVQAVTALIAAGAFDGVHGRESRAALTAAVPICMPAVAAGRALAALGQRHNLAGFHVDLSGQQWALLECLAAEHAVLGRYVSGHPVDVYDAGDHLPVRMIEAWTGDGDRIAIAGLVVSINHKISRQGQPYAVMALADAVSDVEVVWFERFLGELTGAHPGEVVGVTGRVSVRDDRTSVIGYEIERLELAGPEPVVIRADVGALDIAAVRSERAACNGDRPVHLVLTHGARSMTIRIT